MNALGESIGAEHGEFNSRAQTAARAEMQRAHRAADARLHPLDLNFPSY